MRKGTVIDFKFGRVKVTHARDHKPIRIYAAMAVQAYDLDEVRVVIVQPRVSKDDRVTEFTFTKEELATVTDECKQVQDECRNGTQLRYGDIQCRYCPGKMKCVEYMRHTQTTTEELMTIDHAHALANPECIGEYLAKAKSIKKFLDNLEHHAKEMMLKGETVPGWELKTKRGAREITDPQGVFEKVAPVIDVKKFLSCVDVSMSKLEDAYVRTKKELDGTSLKDGKKILADLIEPFMERKKDLVVLTQVDAE